MTKNTHPVNELEAKIKWLATEGGTSEKALLGNHRSTVRAAYKRDRLNADFEQKLASDCGFDPEWREWRTGAKGGVRSPLPAKSEKIGRGRNAGRMFRSLPSQANSSPANTGSRH